MSRHLAAKPKTVSAAAEDVGKPTQNKAGAGAAPHGKAAEISCLPAVRRATVLDLVKGIEIRIIVRLHAHRLADVLQRRDLIADSIIGKGTEIIPPGISLR